MNREPVEHKPEQAGFKHARTARCEAWRSPASLRDGQLRPSYSFEEWWANKGKKKEKRGKNRNVRWKRCWEKEKNDEKNTRIPSPLSRISRVKARFSWMAVSFFESSWSTLRGGGWNQRPLLYLDFSLTQTLYKKREENEGVSKPFLLRPDSSRETARRKKVHNKYNIYKFSLHNTCAFHERD